MAVTSAARAVDCAPATGLSPCIDADGLWLAPDGARFLSLPSARGAPPGTLASGFALSFLSRPVTLRVSSPDPDGRTVPVVERLLDATILERYAVSRSVDVDVALPFALYQTGAGVEGVTSQSAPPIARTAARDPRLGAGYVLVEPAPHERDGVALKARLELSLPFGDRRALASEGAILAAPSLALESSLGPIHGSAMAGARLRRAVRFATAHHGSQALLALGGGFDVLPRALLSLELEAWMLPSLTSQADSLPSGARVEGGLLVQAEWLASLRSRVGDGLELSLGGGTALPLSSVRRVDTRGDRDTERFPAPGSPEYRLTFLVRYAPR
ncbi:MAG: hypothetical protein OZ928_06950 [Polyangiaceae bacterium]|nr:hypothetical protein [Polyangiaceae bacterium]